ncbi:MAG: hypothetical protein IJS67_05705 [Clostridia bacterium]|nr:hypothetical protein [Clostridia bacterium]
MDSLSNNEKEVKQIVAALAVRLGLSVDGLDSGAFALVRDDGNACVILSETAFGVSGVVSRVVKAKWNKFRIKICGLGEGNRIKFYVAIDPVVISFGVVCA